MILCEQCGKPSPDSRQGGPKKYCSQRCKDLAKYLRLRPMDRIYRTKYQKTPKGRYQMHRARALRRGIEWEFTFQEWWSMWEPHWENRGNHGHELCMSRCGDVGPYSVDNVRIITNSENASESHQRIHGPASQTHEYRVLYL